MSTSVVIGKYAIESLTTGMYTDPFVIYREYIQNATDSIDEAIGEGYLDPKQALIRITINPAHQKVTIEDNGVGISSDKAFRSLTDIGNSRKVQGKNRGFRGIGRFSGLSYCNKLSFSTTSIGDGSIYHISFDAQKLHSLIAQNPTVSTAEEAMSRIISEKHSECKQETHFFRVTLEGVSIETGLLNTDKVARYLRETAPVGFSRNFSWGQVITETLKNNFMPISEYKVVLETPDSTIEITKPYEDTFVLNRQTNTLDQITDIAFSPIFGTTNNKVGYAWYGISHFIGTVVNREVKSLRLRVGNILVGDSSTLNIIFKDSRFNGWVIGEIIVDSPEFILNARRDDFEHNDAYYLLMEQLRVLAADIVKTIRNASSERNKEQSQAPLPDDVHIVPPEEATSVTHIVRQQVMKPLSYNSDQTRADEIEQLDLLIGRIQGTSQYKAINVIPGLNKSERTLLDRIITKSFQLYGDKKGELVMNTILSTLIETKVDLDDDYS